jgi:hypothetical protein
MIHAEIPRRRPWVGVIWLVAIALGALLVALHLYAGVLLALSAALVATYIAALQPSMPRAARPRAAPRPAWQPAAQRTIVTADGAEQSALVAPVAGESDLTMVLTVEGYKLVDEAGRVVYALKR